MPSILIQQNGLLENLKSIWTQNAKVLIVCADSSAYEKNDSVCACLKESFPMSGLSISHIDKCDDRNPDAIDDGQTTLYGEAYMIKDRQQTQICKDGESISL